MTKWEADLPSGQNKQNCMCQKSEGEEEEKRGKFGMKSHRGDHPLEKKRDQTTQVQGGEPLPKKHTKSMIKEKQRQRGKKDRREAREKWKSLRGGSIRPEGKEPFHWTCPITSCAGVS